MPVHVESARPQQYAEVSKLLAMIFSRDPVTRSALPGIADPRPYLEAQYQALLHGFMGESGEIDIAVDEDGEILGAALWVAPGKNPSPVKMLKQLPHWLRAIPNLRVLPEVFRRQKMFVKVKPEQPHWYLADIAVTPRARGKKVGSALLDHGLARVDEEKQPAYLEATSADAARLYKRYGFDNAATFEVGQGGENAAVRTMWRNEKV